MTLQFVAARRTLFGVEFRGRDDDSFVGFVHRFGQQLHPALFVEMFDDVAQENDVIVA